MTYGSIRGLARRTKGRSLSLERSRARLLLGLALVTFGCLLPTASADAAKTVSESLGAAGPAGPGAPWAMISLGNFTANGPGINNGNVAVASGSATLSTPFAINGKLFLGQGVSYSSNVTPSEGVSSNPTLVSEAASAARAAAKEFSGLTPTQTFGTLKEGMTITASSTNNYNVIDASAVEMTNGTLTLAGNPNSVFIINVSGNFTSSNSDIVLSGGVLASNIVWNIGGNLTITGGGPEHFYGTAIVINGQATVHDKIWEGEIIAKEITDTSGFRVNSFPPTPEPAFTIKKLQTIFGSGKPFTTSPLEGKVGETVDYEVIVENTGKTSLTFGPLSDAECSSIAPAGSVTLAAGKSQTYTCEHVLNLLDQEKGFHENCATATGTPPPGEGSAVTHMSNCVVVKVPKEPKPEFKIEKVQKIAGSGLAFTKEPLTGKVGETVDYQVVVENTGTTSLTFSSLSDAECNNIEPSGSVTLAVGGSKTYTCEHVLNSTDQAKGFHENCATATGTPPPGEGSPVTHTSNCVVVRVPKEPKPEFKIEKVQKIAGSGLPFTKEPLTAKVGEIVDYEVIVENTGKTLLTFNPLSDANCNAIEPSGSVTLAAGESRTYTCEHVLNSSDQAAGFHENCATATGTPPPGEGSAITHMSNCVVVKVPEEPKPAFKIEKLQKIAGSSGSFTTSPLTGEVGQTVDYEILVENTGTTSLTFAPLSDAECTSIAPAGSVTLAAGKSQTYTCEHVLNSTDQQRGFHENCATATGTPPSGQGSPITHVSNCVVVKVPTPKPHIYVGYVDEGSGHASPTGHPTPWNGSAGVTFAGCGFTGTDTCAKTSAGKDIYDAGAIRIEAPSTESITVTGASVKIGPCSYAPWPGLGKTIPAGGNLILTQTSKTPKCTSTSTAESSNFDTSESFLKSKQFEEFKKGGSKLGTCKNDGFIPEITLTINGVTTTIKDTGQILNHAGIDPDICTGKGEMTAWTQIQ